GRGAVSFIRSGSKGNCAGKGRERRLLRQRLLRFPRLGYRLRSWTSCSLRNGVGAATFDAIRNHLGGDGDKYNGEATGGVRCLRGRSGGPFPDSCIGSGPSLANGRKEDQRRGSRASRWLRLRDARWSAWWGRPCPRTCLVHHNHGNLFGTWPFGAWNGLSIH